MLPRKVLGTIVCILVLLVVVVSASAEEPLSASKGAVEFTGVGGRGFARALIRSEKTAKVFHVCLQDSSGFLWELDISGPNITGTVLDGCDAYWPVTGTHAGLNFDMTATNPCGNGIFCCYCNKTYRVYGTVDRRTKEANGLADELSCDSQVVPWSATQIICP